MSNSLITPTIIAKEALMQLENNLVMGSLVHREYKNEFAKVGATVNIRKPVRFVTTKSSTLTKQDVKESNAAIIVNTPAHVGWEFSSVDLTLTIEEYSERYIKPAAITLANTIDNDLTALYKFVYNEVGTPGVTPSSFQALAAAGQRLDEEGAPVTGRNLVLNPAANWAMADGLKGAFNQSLVSDVIRNAKLGTIANFDIYMDQNVQVATVGPLGTAPLCNNASPQTHTYPQIDPSVGTSSAPVLITDGWGASATARVKAGDVFVIGATAGTPVYAVNPVNKASTGTLRQFVCLADQSSDGSGNIAALKIWPPIITSGPYQNCSTGAADNSSLTFVGTANGQYPQNLAFTRNAFALVMLPMELPDGAPFKARQTASGISIRVVKSYDISADTDIIRLDVLYGVACIYPEMAVRVVG